VKRGPHEIAGRQAFDSYGRHKTSVSLEDEFWNALKKIAGDRNVVLSELIGGINVQRQNGNLSSALRLFVLEYYRGKAAEKPGDEMLDQQSPPTAPALS
jgi:predicted DNA-binding ribbon-helix-helix protein